MDHRRQCNPMRTCDHTCRSSGTRRNYIPKDGRAEGRTLRMSASAFDAFCTTLDWPSSACHSCRLFEGLPWKGIQEHFASLNHPFRTFQAKHQYISFFFSAATFSNSRRPACSNVHCLSKAQRLGLPIIFGSTHHIEYKYIYIYNIIILNHKCSISNYDVPRTQFFPPYFRFDVSNDFGQPSNPYVIPMDPLTLSSDDELSGCISSPPKRKVFRFHETMLSFGDWIVRG